MYPDAIAELKIAIKDKSGDLSQDFKKAAKKLMTEYELIVDDKHHYQLCELEFYYYSKDKHPDPYVHCDEKQKESNTFYVHKKDGNYGGIDITFGDGKNYGGILIRGIRSLAEIKEDYTTPNILKKHLYNILNIKVTDRSYDELQKILNENKRVQLKNQKTNDIGKVLQSVRVGLIAKPEDLLLHNKTKHPLYLYRFYRFIGCPNRKGIKGIENAKKFSEMKSVRETMGMI